MVLYKEKQENTVKYIRSTCIKLNYFRFKSKPVSALIKLGADSEVSVSLTG